jgi:hypothetical protein
VKRHLVARVTPTVAGAARIANLETEKALVPVNSLRHRALSRAIRIEASTYRKALDVEQAAATHDARVQPIAWLGSLERTSRIRRDNRSGSRR